jgi:hypothetical protein
MSPPVRNETVHHILLPRYLHEINSSQPRRTKKLYPILVRLFVCVNYFLLISNGNYQVASLYFWMCISRLWYNIFGLFLLLFRYSENSENENVNSAFLFILILSIMHIDPICYAFYILSIKDFLIHI